MPLTLITTPGAVDANSFATIAEYKDYWGSRLFNDAQLAATDDKITQALVWAARLFKTYFVWNGAPISSDQALPFPRSGLSTLNGRTLAADEIPSEMKEAQSEWAGQLMLTNLTATNSILQKGITAIKAGPVAINYKTGGSTVDMANVDVFKQQPDLAYLSNAVPDAVRNLIPGPWYQHGTLAAPILLEAHR
jgi:hypothetical protein